jgi:hypothetical protein
MWLERSRHSLLTAAFDDSLAPALDLRGVDGQARKYSCSWSIPRRPSPSRSRHRASSSSAPRGESLPTMSAASVLVGRELLVRDVVHEPAGERFVRTHGAAEAHLLRAHRRPGRKTLIRRAGMTPTSVGVGSSARSGAIRKSHASATQTRRSRTAVDGADHRLGHLPQRRRAIAASSAPPRGWPRPSELRRSGQTRTRVRAGEDHHVDFQVRIGAASAAPARAATRRSARCRPRSRLSVIVRTGRRCRPERELCHARP